MSENKKNPFSVLTWVKSRWSPLTLVLIVSALLTIAIVIGALIEHHSNNSKTTRNHLAQQSARASATSTASAASGSSSSAKGTVSSTQSSVIKTASLTLESPHPDTTASHLRNLTSGQGGYIQTMQTRQEQNTETVDMTVRIPSDRFSPFLDNVKSLGTTRNFSQSGRNVTQQSNNLQMRLNQLQSESAAYSRLYRKAKTMKDMLQIQQSLTQVNGEINSVKQQIHHLDKSVQYGTITIHLVPKSPVTVIHQKPVWGPLMQSLHFMRASFLALVTFLSWVLPWGALFGVGLWFWMTWKRRHSGGNKST